jgi:hypothetical protein
MSGFLISSERCHPHGISSARQDCRQLLSDIKARRRQARIPRLPRRTTWRRRMLRRRHRRQAAGDDALGSCPSGSCRGRRRQPLSSWPSGGQHFHGSQGEARLRRVMCVDVARTPSRRTIGGSTPTLRSVATCCSSFDRRASGRCCSRTATSASVRASLPIRLACRTRGARNMGWSDARLHVGQPGLDLS